MMKKTLVLIVIALFSVFNCVQAADIEARTGIMGGDVWGLHAGAYINFPQSTLFSIQTGVLLHTANRSAIGNSDTGLCIIPYPIEGKGKPSSEWGGLFWYGAGSSGRCYGRSRC